MADRSTTGVLFCRWQRRRASRCKKKREEVKELVTKHQIRFEEGYMIQYMENRRGVQYMENIIGVQYIRRIL